MNNTKWQQEEIDNAIKSLTIVEGARYAVKPQHFTSLDWIHYKKLTADIQNAIKSMETLLNNI